MMETLVVVVIVAVAAIGVGQSLWRSARARREGCACVDECPLSEKCDPDTGACAVRDSHPTAGSASR